jgi:hypothetical protein
MNKSKWIVVLPVLLALFAAVVAVVGQEPQVQLQARPPARATRLVVPLSPETGSWQVTVTGQAEASGSLSQAAEAYASAWREAGWDVRLGYAQSDGQDVAQLAMLCDSCSGTAEVISVYGHRAVRASVTCVGR